MTQGGPREDPDLAGVGGGESVGVPSMWQAVTALGAVLGRTATAREAATLVTEITQVLRGNSTLEPPPGDRRFSDAAWSENPVFRRLAQGYLAATRGLDALVEDFEASTDDHRAVERARFTANIISAATAPTNLFATNPAGLKRAFDTGGASVVRGLRNLVEDLRHNGGMPATVARGAFEVGRDLALSPGAVVAREEMSELIQYAPTTDQVRDRPVLIVPPPIGRFYFLDLRPGRSFVEYAVSNEMQTFLVSWRNPGPEQGDWGLDEYAAAVSAAIDHVRAITGSAQVNLVGFCAGGILNATLLSHLAAGGDDRIHSATFGVTLLDFALKAPLGAFANRGLLDLVRRRTERAGVITARQLGAAFTWMRPDDLVFKYVVNNYVLGEPPPAFDILAWNDDGTNLPAALHRAFLDIFRDNSLTRPGVVTLLGSPVDIGRIKVPVFVVGAVADHLTPWKGCYRTTELVGGEATFVLSYSGHIAGLVNPPGNPKAHYWENGPLQADPDAWLAGAQRREGTWWEAWTKWIVDRAGELRPAPTELGAPDHPPLDPAPGRYVVSGPAS